MADCFSIFLWAVVIWISWSVGKWLMTEGKPRPKKAEAPLEFKPPPKPSDEELTRQAAAEYEASKERIAAAKIDESEKDSLLLDAETRYVQKLRDLLR